MEKYLTLAKNSYDEFFEKRSRFIGFAFHVESKEEAESIILSHKSKYWDARHNAFAYVLRDGGIKRFSDDGEPQGTAGMPVLDVIEKQNLTDTLIIVTRYFGGILLGGGGLVRAYSHSASLAISAAGITAMTPVTSCSAVCDYGSYGAVSAFLSANECREIESTFEDNVKVEFCVESIKFDKFKSDFTELTNGKIEIIKKCEKYLSF